MFAKLNGFIDMLEDRERMKAITRDWKTCKEYVYRFHGISENAAMDYVKREYVATDLSVRYPSLLEVKRLNEFGKRSGVSDNIFIMLSVIRRTRKGVEETGTMPLGAYVNGEWRIFTFRLP